MKILIMKDSFEYLLTKLRNKFIIKVGEIL